MPKNRISSYPRGPEGITEREALVFVVYLALLMLIAVSDS